MNPLVLLNDQFREMIFKAAELYFAIWLREGWDPCDSLLKLPEAQFCAKHREQVITAVIDQLTDRQTVQSGRAFMLFFITIIQFARFRR